MPVDMLYDVQDYRVNTVQNTYLIILLLATINSLQADESILQIVFTNVFNWVSRAKILELVCEHFPQMLNLVHYLPIKVF
jgi:hypothetical protein